MQFIWRGLGNLKKKEKPQVFSQKERKLQSGGDGQKKEKKKKKKKKNKEKKQQPEDEGMTDDLCQQPAISTWFGPASLSSSSLFFFLLTNPLAIDLKKLEVHVG